jgi:class 3 adenylate cyclase
MADPSSRRTLAAILSADVVGYSRMMAANEAATVETLRSYRDIIGRRWRAEEAGWSTRPATRF